MVTPDNVFDPNARECCNEDLTQELKQLMQDIAHEASLLLHTMQLLNEVIIQITEHYQSALNQNLATNRSTFTDFAVSIEQYHDHIRLYHELLSTDACSYKIPFWAYKQLRHQLVVRVMIDSRNIKQLVDTFTPVPSQITPMNYLLCRWHRELINLSILAQ